MISQLPRVLRKKKEGKAFFFFLLRTRCVSRRPEVLEDKLPHVTSECFQQRDECPFPLCVSVKRSDSNLIFFVAPTVKNACVPEQNHFHLKLCGGLLLSNISIFQSRGLQALQLQRVRIMQAFALANWISK